MVQNMKALEKAGEANSKGEGGKKTALLLPQLAKVELKSYKPS